MPLEGAFTLLGAGVVVGILAGAMLHRLLGREPRSSEERRARTRRQRLLEQDDDDDTPRHRRERP